MGDQRFPENFGQPCCTPFLSKEFSTREERLPETGSCSQKQVGALISCRNLPIRGVLPFRGFALPVVFRLDELKSLELRERGGDLYQSGFEPFAVG